MDILLGYVMVMIILKFSMDWSGPRFLVYLLLVPMVLAVMFMLLIYIACSGGGSGLYR